MQALVAFSSSLVAYTDGLGAVIFFSRNEIFAAEGGENFNPFYSNFIGFLTFLKSFSNNELKIVRNFIMETLKLLKIDRFEALLH